MCLSQEIELQVLFFYLMLGITAVVFISNIMFHVSASHLLIDIFFASFSLEDTKSIKKISSSLVY